MRISDWSSDVCSSDLLGDLLADAGEGAVLGHLVGPPAVAQVVDEVVGRLGGDLVEVAVVHLEARGLGAGGYALDVFEGEGAVGGGAAGLPAEAVLEVVQQLLAAAQVAGAVGRSEDRSVGKEWDSTCRSGWWAEQSRQKD